MCVVCPVALAVERNYQRQIPIPYSTIAAMEQVLELPDPVNYHWEAGGLVIRNEGTREEFLQSSWSVLVPYTSLVHFLPITCSVLSAYSVAPEV